MLVAGIFNLKEFVHQKAIYSNILHLFLFQFISIYLSICLYIYLSIYLSIYISIYLVVIPSFCLSIPRHLLQRPPLLPYFLPKPRVYLYLRLPLRRRVHRAGRGGCCGAMENPSLRFFLPRRPGTKILPLKKNKY